MDFKSTFSISAIGMAIEKARINVATMNLAYAHAPLDKAGQGYKAMQVQVHVPASFSSYINAANSGQGQIEAARIQIVPSLLPTRLQFEPGHPLADKDGNVGYPGVDTAQEMMTMMSAMRAYEANVAAMNISKTLALKSLEIGGGS